MITNYLLQVNVSKDLAYLNYHAPWFGVYGEHNIVRNPLSLFECPRTGCLGPSKCKFDSLPDAKLIRQLIRNGLVVNYDNVSISWYSGESVWPPTLDTFFLLRVLRDHGYFEREDWDSIWDLGCGTGAIGIYAATKSKHVNKFGFLDVNEKAISRARINSEQNGLTQLLWFQKINGIPNKIPLFNNERILIISSPPYFPVREKDLDRGAFGLSLLHKILKYDMDKSDEIVIVCSDWNGDLFTQLTSGEPGLSPTYRLKELGSMLVPLNLPDVSASSIEFLEDRGFIHALNINNFRYWHRIRVWALRRQ